MKVLVLGSNGMIGNAIYTQLKLNDKIEVFNTEEINSNSFEKFDASKLDHFESFFKFHTFNVVINCIGITKHRNEIQDIYKVIMINSIFPWKLLNLAKKLNFKLIHISTDCVFDGMRGNYSELDIPNALDLYGRTKALGEITNDESCLTIRTSTIGHELNSKRGLLEWFLSQKKCKGFVNAIFSGLPSNVLAKIIEKYLINNININGLLNIGSLPINKYDLLTIVKNTYDLDIEIVPDYAFKIDRTLNCNKFKSITKYVDLDWKELILIMKNDWEKNKGFSNV